MDTHHVRAGRLLRVGLGTTGAAILLGLLSAPFLIVATISFIATWLLLATVYGRATRRWRWTWTIAAASVVWVSTTVLTMELWGEAYDLSEAYRPVPAALDRGIGGAALIGTTALIVLMSSGIAVVRRIRRLPSPTREVG